MIRKVKKKLLASIKNKRINVFFLFLVMAFIILIISKLSKSYTNTIAFKIEKINVPDEKVILNNSDSILNITLNTHGFKWLDYYFKSPKITIDFSEDVTLGHSKFIWTKANTRLFSNTEFTKQVKIINIYPDSLFFNFDVNSVKKIPVKLRENISFSPGFDSFDGFTITPDSIKIIGPKHVIDTIGHIETEAVILKGVKTDIHETIKLDLPIKNDNIRFSSKSVDLSASVERFTEGVMKIPITIVNVPKELKIKYFPKEVTITFYTSLDHFKMVKPMDFKIICDYNMLNTESSFFIAELVKTSKYVKSVKINNQHIEFIIL